MLSKSFTSGDRIALRLQLRYETLRISGLRWQTGDGRLLRRRIAEPNPDLL